MESDIRDISYSIKGFAGVIVSWLISFASSLWPEVCWDKSDEAACNRSEISLT